MAYEVYRLTLTLGTERSLFPESATNVFHFAVDNQTGEDPYSAAIDVSALLVGNFGWLDFYLHLQVLAIHVRSWQCVRVFPQRGTTFDGTITLYPRCGTRIVTLGARAITTVVGWIPLSDDPPRLRTEIPFSAGIDWTDDQIWFAYRTEVQRWAQIHVTPFITPNGNPGRSCVRRKGGLFDELQTFLVHDQPGRRKTRRRSFSDRRPG